MVGYVYIEASFDTIFNMGYGFGKSRKRMGKRANLQPFFWRPHLPAQFWGGGGGGVFPQKSVEGGRLYSPAPEYIPVYVPS